MHGSTERLPSEEICETIGMLQPARVGADGTSDAVGWRRCYVKSSTASRGLNATSNSRQMRRPTGCTFVFQDSGLRAAMASVKEKFRVRPHK